jgi:hypothetical protein
LTLEDLLGEQTIALAEVLAELGRCRAAVERCLAWHGNDDRERSVRAVVDGALRSCLDAVHMAELGIARNRRDMVESAAVNLGSAHERVSAISRGLREQ